MGERKKVRGVFNTVPLIPAFSPQGRRRTASGDSPPGRLRRRFVFPESDGGKPNMALMLNRELFCVRN